MGTSPSPNGPDGERDSQGRFIKGNAGGPGNPLGARVARLRASLMGAVSEADMAAIIQTLVSQAKNGDIAAAKVIIERCLGRPIEHDLLERLEAVEAAAGISLETR